MDIIIAIGMMNGGRRNTVMATDMGNPLAMVDMVADLAAAF